MFGFTIKHYKVTHFESRPKKVIFYLSEIIGGRWRCYRLRVL